MLSGYCERFESRVVTDKMALTIIFPEVRLNGDC